MKRFILCLFVIFGLVFYVISTSLFLRDDADKIFKTAKTMNPLENFARKKEYFQIFNQHEDVSSKLEKPSFKEYLTFENYNFLKDYAESLRAETNYDLLLTKTNIVVGTINDQNSLSSSEKISLLGKIKNVRDRLISYREAQREISQVKTKLKEVDEDLQVHRKSQFEKLSKGFNDVMFGFEKILLFLGGGLFLVFLTYAYLSRLVIRGMKLNEKQFHDRFNKFRGIVENDYQLLSWNQVSSLIPVDKKKEFQIILEKKSEAEFRAGNLLFLIYPMDKNYYAIRRVDLELEEKIRTQITKEVNKELDISVERTLVGERASLYKYSYLDTRKIDQLDRFVETIKETLNNYKKENEILKIELSESKSEIDRKLSTIEHLRQRGENIEQIVQQKDSVIEDFRKKVSDLENARKKDQGVWQEYHHELQEYFRTLSQMIRALRLDENKVLYQRINAVCLSILSGNPDLDKLQRLSSLCQEMLECLETDNINTILAKLETLYESSRNQVEVMH